MAKSNKKEKPPSLRTQLLEIQTDFATFSVPQHWYETVAEALRCVSRLSKAKRQLRILHQEIDKVAPLGSGNPELRGALDELRETLE